MKHVYRSVAADQSTEIDGMYKVRKSELFIFDSSHRKFIQAILDEADGPPLGDSTLFLANKFANTGRSQRTNQVSPVR
jgi:hypothetical protein